MPRQMDEVIFGPGKVILGRIVTSFLIRIMRLKTFVAIAFLVAFSYTAHAQAGWMMQPTNIRGDLVAVYFTSSDKGWVAGDGGFLASTTDGGKSWMPYPLNIPDDINEIYFRNDENGYLVAGRRMFVTRDGGKSWQ